MATLVTLMATEQFDLVHLETTQIWPAVAACGALPAVLGTQNVESHILTQLGNACRNPLKRLLYRVESVRMRQFEERAWRSCRLCLTVSNEERHEVIAAGVSPERVVTVPNGVDLERFAFAPRPGRKRLLFLGGLNYHPNMDAAKWLLDQIWPLIHQADPETELLLAGRKTEQLVAPADAGVTFLGDPLDVPECFAMADVLLVPLRIGAGTRLKVLEAMAAGLPVISTAIGYAGVDAVDGEQLLAADSPREFVSAVCNLFSNRELAGKIAANGRALVESRYSWQKVLGTLSAHYETVRTEP
jgi:glycosyltransferase involved in cell wall biosynthesis